MVKLKCILSLLQFTLLGWIFEFIFFTQEVDILCHDECELESGLCVINSYDDLFCRLELCIYANIICLYLFYDEIISNFRLF